ncbi:recombinase family protein [Rhizobium sullae]|uniref:recombinase family protein n=1 Tax=Rhizobium sullae TaxID=50338 RepID=UPI003CC7CAC5
MPGVPSLGFLIAIACSFRCGTNTAVEQLFRLLHLRPLCTQPSYARADRPELLRLIADLQPGEVVIAEKIDRISRLPLPEAEKLIETIRDKGARLAVPGIVELTDIAAGADGIAKIVIESLQGMLLKLALQMARDDFEDRRERQRQGIELAKASGKYAGRQADQVTHERILSSGLAATASAGRPS